MVRNGHNLSICIWYEMVIMYRSPYGTKMIFTMVRNDVIRGGWGRGVPKSTHDAPESTHAWQNELHH